MASAQVEVTEDAPLLDTIDYIVLSVAVAALVGFIISRLASKPKKIEKKKTVNTFTLPAQDDDFVAKMKTTGKNVVIFFGSQTGTAEEFAQRLAKDARKFGLHALVADLQDYDLANLSRLHEIENAFAMFCIATYGEGDPTDNAQPFFTLLKDSVENQSLDLANLKYLVFGLGNKTYEHYQAAGRFVDKTLADLGATRICDIGEGDETVGIEEDFLNWKDQMWQSVCDHYAIKPATGDLGSTRQYTLREEEFAPEAVFTGEPSTLRSFARQRGPYTAKNPYLAAVAVNRELYKGDRSCRHLEFSIQGSNLRYETGDHVAVYPQNSARIVDRIGQLLNVDLDKTFALKAVEADAKKQSPFPTPCTYRTALTHYVNITGHPSKNVLKEIAEYAADPKHKEFLLDLIVAANKAKYHSWIIDDCRTIVEVLEELPSVKPPLDFLLELLPRLQCRYYSISSSSKVHPQSVHVTAAIVKYTTPLARAADGVATSWMSAMDPTGGEFKVPISIRVSGFRLPNKSVTPIIMIGPGTGLAPFRGFIQERALQRKNGQPVGETVLFFGCQRKAEHYLYEEELTQYTTNGDLTLHIAFSRDQAAKRYVTHLLRENKEQVWKLLSDGAHIYVCGDATNMANDVHAIFIDIAKEIGQKSDNDAHDYFKMLSSKKRYQQDVWS